MIVGSLTFEIFVDVGIEAFLSAQVVFEGRFFSQRFVGKLFGSLGEKLLFRRISNGNEIFTDELIGTFKET